MKWRQTMSDTDKPIDPILFELVIDAAKDGLQRIQELKDGQKYIGKYYGWAELSSLKSGLPYVRESYVIGSIA